jgi:hypothetical protein
MKSAILLVLLGSAIALHSCTKNESFFVPRIGMDKNQLLEKIGRTTPDTFPVGKPPYFFNVPVFGLKGTLGIYDSNNRITLILFSPNDRSDNSWGKMNSILNDSFGIPTEIIPSTASSAHSRYAWEKGKVSYELSRGSKYMWFSGIIESPSQYDSNGMLRVAKPSIPPPP